MYRVEADYAEQRGDQMIEFQNVRIDYSPESGVPWTVAADTATITEDQKLLMLEGHVVATSDDDAHSLNEFYAISAGLSVNVTIADATIDSRTEAFTGTLAGAVLFHGAHDAVDYSKYVLNRLMGRKFFEKGGEPD